jgi:hypothetical protein
MFPVTPIWSIGHPPHTATELRSSLQPSPHSSTVWPPFELIFSVCYSVVPFVLNLVDSIQEPFDLHRREVSAVYVPTIPNFFVSFIFLLGLGPFSSIILVANSFRPSNLKNRFIKVYSCVVIFLDTSHDSLAYNKTYLTFELKILILVLSFSFLELHMSRMLLKAAPALFLRFIISSWRPPSQLTTDPR